MPRRESLRARILLTSGIPLAATAVLAIGASMSSKELSESNARVEHRHDVIVSALQLQQVIADLERGRNGFIATGNEELLNPFVSGKAGLILAFDATYELIQDEPDQVAQLRDVRAVVRYWLERIAEPSIALASKLFNEVKDQSFLRNLVARGAVRELCDRMDSELDSMAKRLRDAGHSELGVLALRAARDYATVGTTQRGFLLTGDADFLVAYRGALERFDATLSDLAESLRSEQSTAPELARLSDRVTRLQKLRDEWVNGALEPEINARSEQERIHRAIEAARVRLYSGEGSDTMARVRRELGEFIAAQESRMHALRQEANEVASRTRQSTVLGSVITLLLSVIIAFFVASGITAPVAALVRATRRVARGDLSARAGVAASGEIGELAHSFDRMVRDVQELTESLEHSRAEAVEANVAKSNFLANMSHEIRTPMTAILGYSDLLLEPDIDDEQRIDCVQTVRRNGEQLLRIINDILDLSKLEAGKFEIESLRVDPRSIARDALDLLAVRASSKGLALECTVRGRVPRTIQTDPTRLSQILINLTGNALKFTEKGGVEVVISFVEDGEVGHYVFEVIDTGVGMSPEMVARIFEPFTQADETVTRKFGGTGLGLAISTRFSELLGGELQVESELGVGSTFRLRLPTGPVAELEWVDGASETARPAAANEPAAEVRKPAARPLDGRRILLAEDGRDNQRLISLFLKKAGAEVAIAENGREAIDAVVAASEAESQFDVVLMDMQMPVLDGYAATGALREQGFELPIVAITAHAMSGDREKCIDAGCSAYETKPIKARRLIETVRELCELSTSAP